MITLSYKYTFLSTKWLCFRISFLTTLSSCVLYFSINFFLYLQWRLSYTIINKSHIIINKFFWKLKLNFDLIFLFFYFNFKININFVLFTILTTFTLKNVPSSSSSILCLFLFIFIYLFYFLIVSHVEFDLFSHLKIKYILIQKILKLFFNFINSVFNKLF